MIYFVRGNSNVLIEEIHEWHWEKIHSSTIGYEYNILSENWIINYPITILFFSSSIFFLIDIYVQLLSYHCTNNISFKW